VGVTSTLPFPFHHLFCSTSLVFGSSTLFKMPLQWAITFPICCVDASPPRPGSYISGPATATSQPFSIALAAQDIQMMNIKPRRVSGVGFAIPFLNIRARTVHRFEGEGNLRSGLRLADGAMPRLPATAAPRSERMSPNRLLATTTLKLFRVLHEQGRIGHQCGTVAFTSDIPSRFL